MRNKAPAYMGKSPARRGIAKLINPIPRNGKNGPLYVIHSNGRVHPRFVGIQHILFYYVLAPSRF